MSARPAGISINEMKEFATFPARTQRYIRRSLDVAGGIEGSIDKWSRSADEASRIRLQRSMYARLDPIRRLVPIDSGASCFAGEPLMSPLVAVSAFDLGEDRLPSFGAYRFLYERMIGARSRPWLPSAFMAAAGLPHIRPDLRRTLLQSISEAAATAPGWSSHDPVFFPSWVDKVEPEGADQ